MSVDPDFVRCWKILDELDAGPYRSICGAVPGQSLNFGEIVTSLLVTYVPNLKFFKDIVKVIFLIYHAAKIPCSTETVFICA